MERMLTEALTPASSGCRRSNCFSTSSTATSCRSRTLPSTYAKPRELRRLKSLLRRTAGSCSPDRTSRTRSTSARSSSQSLGFVRKPLKTSLLSAADVKANPYAIKIMGPLARLVNRLGGDFRWQHLPVPFEVYADGIDLVVFEEFGSGAAALHLRDEVERNELLRDEAYRRQFRKDYESKFGVRVWHRDFFDAEIVDCPDASVIGKSFGQVGRTAAVCTRSTRSWTWCSSTAGRCAGAQRSPTTGPRCSRSWRASPASRWASPTRARTFATWRSTTWACGCCAMSATPSRPASRS